MEITIFAKKRTTGDGRDFTSYISRLTKKDGSVETVSVNFRQEAGQPKAEKCPMNVVFDKKNANLSVTDAVDKDGNLIVDNNGEIVKSKKLWISAWKEGSPYVDHSLDDFE